MDCKAERKALINEGILSLYGKPEPGQVVTDEGLYGMSCSILEEQGDYVYIRMEYGYKGWVLGSGLREGAWAPEDRRMRVMKRNMDVMESPEVASPVYKSMPMGSVVALAEGEEKEGWTCVRLADGRKGYTKTSYLVPCVELNREGPDMDEETFRVRVTEMVKMYEGTHYRWGGKSPFGIDCSGLCSMAYLLCGVVIHRDASLEPEFCMHKIERKDMKPGDLLFFPGHVAMYLRVERLIYIHSTAKAGSDGVDYNSLKPGDPLYREDLDKGILYIGSIYPLDK